MPVSALGTTSQIYLASAGEAPRAGAFFEPDNSWTLSKIARVVYKDAAAWKIINMNQWNIDNLVYRNDSTSCYSKKQDPVWAKTTISPTAQAKTAYISLCQRDAHPMISYPARTFKFPVLWIPDPANMPMPVSSVDPGEPPTQPTGPSTVIKVTPVDLDFDPSPKTDPTSFFSDEGDGVNPSSRLAGFGLVAGGIVMLCLVLLLPGSETKR